VKTVAAITIGQSPRETVIEELARLVPGVRWREEGALDGLDAHAIGALAPRPGEMPLVARLRDGAVVALGENQLQPLMQQAIERAEAAADVVLVQCASDFEVTSRAALVLPARVLAGIVGALGLSRVAVFCPHAGQVAWERARWKRLGVEAAVTVVPPYHGADLAAAAREALAQEVQAILLDCFGYTLETRCAVADACGLPAILLRSLACRVVAELVGGC
jgi:protein AroM